MEEKISAVKSLRLNDTEVTGMSWEDTGSFLEYRRLPRFFRIVLKSTPGRGSLIYSELWLPERWNGIFLGLGNGGMAGKMNYSELSESIRKGYAAANTDMGTSGGRDSGIDNPDVWKDFGWRATHIMTEISKRILRMHYGRRELYSYFIGQSTGGQQALALAERFPLDYDGMIAAAPANNRVFLHIYFLWNHNHLCRADGSAMFSGEEILRISECAAVFFQNEGDGERGDNFVSFPYLGEGTVERFLAFLHEKHPEFTGMQLEALHAVYHGPVNPVTGEQIFAGMPIGAEQYGCGIEDCQQKESPNFYPFIWAFGRDYDGRNFDFDRDVDAIAARLSSELNANQADLRAFAQHGGKLIVLSGSADPCVPFADVMRYCERVTDMLGGYEKASRFFRCFLVPGKDHGRNGKGSNVIWGDAENRSDLLTVLRGWREKGEAPQSLTAARIDFDTGKTVFARDIFPYGSSENEKRSLPKSCCGRYL